MNNQKKYNFEIGDKVIVLGRVMMVKNTVLDGHYKGDERKTLTTIALRDGKGIPGVVSGATRIQEGTISYCRNSEQNVLVFGRSHFVYLVRFGLTNKPVRVLEEDMEKIGFINRFPSRWTSSTTTSWARYAQGNLPGMEEEAPA